jgi:glyoxylase-like metal-dependent hydrolase (beta-lactamase superfamily II)
VRVEKTEVEIGESNQDWSDVMAIKKVANENGHYAYVVPLGFVNAFLIDEDGLTLIDTGIPGSTGKIMAGVEALGKKPTDIRAILITHLHYDHTGSLGEIKRLSGAEVWMHAADASLIRQGIPRRPVRPAPGLMDNFIGRRLFERGMGSSRVKAVEVEHEVQDGAVLPLAGGIQAIHIPGHTAGHTVFLWQGVLFAGDALTRMFGLGHPPIYENLQLGKESLKKLGMLEFSTLCFSHGEAITGDAAIQQCKRKLEKLAR